MEKLFFAPVPFQGLTLRKLSNWQGRKFIYIRKIPKIWGKYHAWVTR